MKRTTAARRTAGARAGGAGERRARAARLDVDARRAQLLALGVEMFATRPYDDVSIDEVARQAGISKGLLYHYFPTKRDFYVAAVREGARQLLARTEPPESLPPLERLTHGLDAYLDFVEDHGGVLLAVLRGGIGSDPQVAAIVEETRAEFVGRLLRGLPVIADDALVALAMRGWVGFVEAATIAWAEGRAAAREQVRELLASVLIASLRLAAPGVVDVADAVDQPAAR